MAITILAIEQNTDEWLAAREGKVTGSNADCLLTRGLDEALKDNYKRFKGNFYTQRGHILEVEAIEVYEAIHDCKVSRPGFIINDRFENVGCSPDGIDGEWLIEVKCFGAKKHLEIRKPKQIPFKIMAQLQFNMMISELKKARLVMYNPDIEDDSKAYCEIEVKADPKIQLHLQSKLRGE
jgi:hypothetical protein